MLDLAWRQPASRTIWRSRGCGSPHPPQTILLRNFRLGSGRKGNPSDIESMMRRRDTHHAYTESVRSNDLKPCIIFTATGHIASEEPTSPQKELSRARRFWPDFAPRLLGSLRAKPIPAFCRGIKRRLLMREERAKRAAQPHTTRMAALCKYVAKTGRENFPRCMLACSFVASRPVTSLSLRLFHEDNDSWSYLQERLALPGEPRICRTFGLMHDIAPAP
jgi:hypothetical protein